MTTSLEAMTYHSTEGRDVLRLVSALNHVAEACVWSNYRDMFDVSVCEARRIILVSFRGEVTEADFLRLDARGRDAQGGPAYDVIFDMTAVERAELETELIDKRGRIPQAFKDRTRIYVVAQPNLKLLVRLYAAYQQA